MVDPWHDRKSFFKYYTAESAILTLENTTRKWSTPLEFNDPFDNQFDLNLEEPNEELAQKLVQNFHENILSPKPLASDQFGPVTPLVELIRQVHIANPDFQYSESDMAELNEAMMEGMKNVIARAPEHNNEVRRLMADTSIFCLSKTCDNLLMWSHYAHNHTGAVVEFLSMPEVDSPLIVAQPVRYSQNMPRMNFEDLQGVEPLTRQVLETLTLTKSDVWAYEQEWRIVTTLRHKGKPYEILPYAPEEVGSIYLGCKINEEDKSRIIQITREKYPNAKVFQAEKHPAEYKLVFKIVD